MYNRVKLYSELIKRKAAAILIFFTLSSLQVSISVAVGMPKKNWKIHETKAFQIYYAAPSQDKAQMSAEFLESEYDRVTETIGYIPVEKIVFYLIPEDPQDFKVPKSPDIGKVEAGSQSLKKDLIIQFTSCLLAKMYTKRTMKYMDDWFISGISGYIAQVEPEYEEVSQTTFEPVNLETLKGDPALLTGNLIWNYLVETNGEGVIAHILNNARILQSDKGAIEQFIGIPFEMVMANCREYYYD